MGKLLKKNPNCDMQRCLSSEGEVRRLPWSETSDGAYLVCQFCHRLIMSELRRENNDRHPDDMIETPAWESLPVYDVADCDGSMSPTQ